MLDSTCLCSDKSQRLDMFPFPLHVKILYTHSLLFPQCDIIHHHAIQVEKENDITLMYEDE